MKQRKSLSADGLFKLVRKGFKQISDHREMNVAISLTDALFSLKDPSLLAFDERRAKPENLQWLYGLHKIPSDTQMRTILDEVEPETLRPVYSSSAGPARGCEWVVPQGIPTGWRGYCEWEQHGSSGRDGGRIQQREQRLVGLCGAGGGGSVAYLPSVFPYSSTQPYTGIIIIQNVSGTASDVRFSVNRTEEWTEEIKGHGWKFTTVSSGSAKVESLTGQALVVWVDTCQANSSGDNLMSYVGDNR